MKFNLDELPQVQLDTTHESADWLRTGTLSYYDDGMTREQFMARLRELGIDVDQFKTTVTYRAALERGDPDWIDEL